MSNYTEADAIEVLSQLKPRTFRVRALWVNESEIVSALTVSVHESGALVFADVVYDHVTARLQPNYGRIFAPGAWLECEEIILGETKGVN